MTYSNIFNFSERSVGFKLCGENVAVDTGYGFVRAVSEAAECVGRVVEAFVAASICQQRSSLCP
jgi:hypothetical protein